MSRFSTIRAQSAGPAVAGLVLVAVLVSALALFIRSVAPPIHGPTDLGQPAREFLYRLFPTPPMPDRHPRVTQTAHVAGDR